MTNGAVRCSHGAECDPKKCPHVLPHAEHEGCSKNQCKHTGGKVVSCVLVPVTEDLFAVPVDC